MKNPQILFLCYNKDISGITQNKIREKKGDGYRMNKKWKKGIAILCAAVFVTGCGMTNGDTQAESNMTGTAEQEKITLEVYAWTDEEENIRLLSEAYMEQHENIQIHRNIIPISQFGQRMLSLKNGQTKADCIFSPNASECAIWKNKKILQDLSEYLEDSELLDAYGEWYEAGENENSSYMIPYRQSRWAVYYNKTLFDERNVEYPGENWTWEDYAETAVALTGRVNGEKVWGSLSFEPTNKWWRVPARTAGANDPFIKADLEQFRKAAEYIYDLTYTLKAQQPYTQQDSSNAVLYNEAFLEGNIGMFFSGDWSAATLNRQIKEQGLDFSYDIAPMPHWEGEESYTISDAAVIAMVAGSEHPEETFDFMKFVAGPEGARILAENDVIPAWNSEEIQELYLSNATLPEHKEYFWQKGKISRVPGNIRYSEGIDIVGDEVAKYLLQKQTLDETFDKIEEELNKVW